MSVVYTPMRHDQMGSSSGKKAVNRESKTVRPPARRQKELNLPDADVRIKLEILWFAGVVTVVMLVIGLLALLFLPENAKDIWLMLSPVVSATLTGVLSNWPHYRRTFSPANRKTDLSR